MGKGNVSYFLSGVARGRGGEGGEGGGRYLDIIVMGRCEDLLGV